MTKVYNDIEALTRLLEEKERDLELAAQIGKSLLDTNQQQAERIDELEKELLKYKDKIVQLRHEISAKKELLQIYQSKEDEEDEEYLNSFDDSSISSHRSPQKAAELLDTLEKRVNILESENKKLKTVTEQAKLEIEIEEKKELQLIDECARRLHTANKQISLLQEEITRKNETNGKLNDEIFKLSSQITNLEKHVRKLKVENEGLDTALQLAHECQSELSLELIDIKDKQNNLLAAYHEKQEECRQLAKRHSFSDSFFPYSDSLAFELENSLNGALLNLQSNDDANYSALDSSFNYCVTPDSLLSSDSFQTCSPFTSFCATSVSTNSDSTTINKLTTTSSTSSTSSLSSTATTVINSRTVCRNHLFSDKLRFIKPIEGSQILNHWRRLASPNLNCLLDNKENYFSRIQTNLTASKIKVDALDRNKPSTGIPLVVSAASQTNYPHHVTIQNNFVTTNSVFTFTTTSLSHMKDSITRVTTSFSDVQPSTGKNGFGLDVPQLSSFKASIDDIQSIVHLQNLNDHSKNGQNGTKEMLLSNENDAEPKKKNSMKCVSRIDAATALAGNKQIRMESLSGLNELSKLIEKDTMNLFTAFKPLSSNRRVMTKAMIANASDISNMTNIAKSDFFRTDLSVLRNLRKGGLI